jgi:pimeloyl-ACP methyl ester carboxylesterase
MLGFLTVLALGLATTGPAATDPVIVPAEFRDYFDAARKGKLEIPDDAIEEARRYRYVFVGGFHNERLPGYFTQNAKELRAIGVPKKAIHFIYPSSHRTVAENARGVRHQFEDIAEQGPEKLVVIAHSRGACDTLAFALENPDFVLEYVHSMFLIQGPFGGTGLADYVVGEGPPLDRRMPLGHRVIANTLANVEGFLLDHGKHGGLPELTRQASEEFWTQLLEETSAAIPIVGPKTFYITSQIPAKGHRIIQRAIASYLETNFGENDGIVAISDQSLPGLGTVLAVLDAGHTDLTNRFPSGKAAQRMRKAVVDAIVMAVGESDTSEVVVRRGEAKEDSSVARTARRSRSVNTGRR